MYGYSEDEHKHRTSLLLKSLKNESEIPWLCGGDFNLMLISSEKKGGNGFNDNDVATFREALRHCNLVDLGFIGHECTWINNRGGDQNVQERLDRFMANEKWKSIYVHRLLRFSFGKTEV